MPKRNHEHMISAPLVMIHLSKLHKHPYHPHSQMPLNKILSEWDQPVKPDVINEIITYMKTMPQSQETLLIQCAEHLEHHRTLGAVLAVVHALNNEEFLLRCHDEDLDDTDLSKELERMLMSDGNSSKNSDGLSLYGAKD